jgi:ornithine cyclodeaminase/alanine dehydrogenase-like protein (mu-crystallin family)
VAAGGGDDTGNSGAVFVLDQSTLRLSAILCDEGLLTEVRTAVACAYASRAAILRYKHYHQDWDTKQIFKNIGLVGGGVQAIWHLRLLAATIFDSRAGEGGDRPVVVLKTQSK